MLHLAIKAFARQTAFPVMHVDTGHNFDEVIATRDELVQRYGLRLVVASVQDDIDAGRVVDTGPSRNPLQTVTCCGPSGEPLRRAPSAGPPRRGEGPRQERVFSFRDEFGQWNPKAQRPELWNLYNGRYRRRAHPRLPLSNWTEYDIWAYIGGRTSPAVDLLRPPAAVFRRDGMLLAVHEHMQPREEEVFETSVRFRTVGDVTCTGCVESTAATVEDVIAETAASRLTERGATRADDRISRPAWRTAKGPDDARRARMLMSARAKKRNADEAVMSSHRHRTPPCCGWPPPAPSMTAKSTLIGRLLYDSKAVMEDQLAAVERTLA